MRRIVLAPLAALFLCASAAHAAPVPTPVTVTSGTLRANWDAPGAFTLQIGGATYRGRFYGGTTDGGWSWMSGPFSPGDRASASGTLVGLSFMGPLEVEYADGTTRRLYGGGLRDAGPVAFWFSGGSITYGAPGGYSTDFTFTGLLGGAFDQDRAETDLDVFYALSGRGRLTVLAEATNPSGTVFVNTGLYAFSVPEPATLALLTLGLLGAGVATRRRARA